VAGVLTRAGAMHGFQADPCRVTPSPPRFRLRI